MQTYFKHGMGDSFRLYFEIFKNNVGQIGESPTVAIQKQATDEWLNDGLSAWLSGGEYNDIALTEAPSGDLPGVYYLDISHIDDTAETYNCYFKNTGDNVGNDFESHQFSGAVYVPSSSAYTSETVLGHLDDIKHKDGNKTFDNTTDSLEALVDNGVSSADLDVIAKEATSLAISGDIQAIDDGLFSEGGQISKVLVQPIQGNFSYTSIKNQRVETKRASTVDITYGLSQNISGYDVFFAVKEDYRDTDYVIAEKDITASVIDASIGTGLISLTAIETDLEDGDYIGELKLVKGSIIAKPIEFRLRISPTIFT